MLDHISTLNAYASRNKTQIIQIKIKKINFCLPMVTFMYVPRLSCSHSASAQLHRCNLGVDWAITISYLDIKLNMLKLSSQMFTKGTVSMRITLMLTVPFVNICE